MTMKIRHLFGGFGLLIVLGLFPGASFAQALQPGEAEMFANSEKAPAWELKDVNGNIVKSSDLTGKVVILDFWATWCPPCRAEIPGFVALQKQYADKGVVVVGVSLDEQGSTVVKTFMNELGMNYPVVLGNMKIVQDFGGIQGIPTTFVINRKGDVVSGHVGFTAKETFEKEIAPLI